MVVLFPGDAYQVGSAYRSVSALERFRAAYANKSSFIFDDSAIIPLQEIAAAFEKLASHLNDKYPKALLSLLKPVTVEIPDLNTTVVFSIAKGKLREASNSEPDLIIKSQPLHFGFSFPFGVQTLGVSARYTLSKGFPNWQRHRILFSLNNAELYLKPRYLLTTKNLAFFWDRLPGALNQFMYRMKVMR